MNRRQSPARPRPQSAMRPAAVAGGFRPDALQAAWGCFGRGERGQAESLCRSLLAGAPDHAGASSLLGIILAQSQRTEEAARLLGRAAALLPDDPSAHNNYGNVLRDLGRHALALSAYERALALQPDYADAHYNRALALQGLGRFEEAVAGYDRTLVLNPSHAAVYNNRGAALQALGRLEDAVASYDRAITLKPDYAGAYNNRGAALFALQRIEEALASHERALALQPDLAGAHNNRGVALRKLGRLEEAAASFDRAIAAAPEYAPAHDNRGVVLKELHRPAEALASYERAIALGPQYAEAHNNRGLVLRELGRLEEAAACFAKALAANACYPEALLNHGATLHDLRRFHEALASHERALALKSDYAEVYRNQGHTLHELRRTDEALASYERALALTPSEKFLRGTVQHARMHICDWRGIEPERAALTVSIEAGRAVISPFRVLSLFDSPALQRRAAAIWAREECRTGLTRLPPLKPHPRHERIRVGYFSADFRNHAVSALAAELFETHDRSGFEITAFSLGPDAQGALRGRIERAFDRFVPVFGQSDEEIAALARRLEIDVAVDLGGYTQDARPRIFALRAAPIQVSYLGYLGTLGADFMDYLLADEVIVPREQRRHYAERIAYLQSYQANDGRRAVSDRTFTRADLGLPADGFVFCCLNANYKITPETFASWMRILAAAPGSTLLLLAGSQPARQNLKQHAIESGIDPSRLVFAGKVPYEDYVARYRVADLFLDTLPYNAGATASDALWAGLPVLTCAGESFAARMGASLLTAVGLPELIATDCRGYERLAIELAGQPDRLAGIRAKLADARSSTLLFDTRRLVRGLETLFTRMYDRHRLGLLPEHLLLEPPQPASGAA
jgi:protein O-GlcNAc transferase